MIDLMCKDFDDSFGEWWYWWLLQRVVVLVVAPAGSGVIDGYLGSWWHC